MSWNLFWTNLFYSSVALLIFVGLGIAFIQFGYYRNMKKKRNFYATLQGDIKKGDKVTFSNGLYGVIRTLDGETADIEVKSGAIITVSRFVIESIEK